MSPRGAPSSLREAPPQHSSSAAPSGPAQSREPAQTQRDSPPAPSPPQLSPAFAAGSLSVCQGTGRKAGGQEWSQGQSPCREGPTFELLYGPQIGVIREERGAGLQGREATAGREGAAWA